MRALLLLTLAAAPCAALSPEIAPTVKTEKRLAQVEAKASTSAAARRLFAAARRVPRREVRGPELPDAINTRGEGKPELVIDAARLERASEADVELLLVLNSARAFFSFPVPIVEAEQAAWQKTLLFAVERGADDPAGFGAILAKAEREQAPRGENELRATLPAPTPWERSSTPMLKLPDNVLARAGLLLHLLDKDPERFYRAVEEGTSWPPGAVRLGELEDLYALRAKDIAALAGPPEGAYATLAGRRYPGPLVRAAVRMKGTGEVERLRESLEAYDSVGLASMRIAINRWRRAVGP